MPEAVDVGSVLGGRYKVTAYVLASADKDLVLDGVDQVLNRPVSILVASTGNAEQVTATARALASGDRDENIQVLDLSITESGTYLVTNRAPAADMLDLIVQREVQPETDVPFVEPFFTDTLGSEIFGHNRSTEPETHGDEYDVTDEDQHRPSRLAGLARRFGRQETDDAPDADRQDDTSALPPVPAASTPNPRSTHSVPPPPARRPGGATASAGSSTEAREQPQDEDQRYAVGGAAGVAAATAAGQPGRSASYFPLSDDQYDEPDDVGPDEYDEYEDGDGGGRKFTRLLVGAVLTVGLVIAVVIAATTLGGLTSRNNSADAPVEQVTSEAAAPETTAPPATASAAPTPEPVTPVVADILRVVPDNQALDAGNDGTLPLIIDGDLTTFWGNQVYASDTFGGLASNLALVLQLEEESTVSEVSITQLNGSGGSFSVLLNDQPSLEGAEDIAQGSFTAPTVTLPIPEGATGQPTAQYVIVNFTQLPRLAIQAQFPFGLRIAEIEVD